MILRALRCRLTSSGEESLDVSSWAGTATELADGETQGAYLVRRDEFVSLQNLTRIVNDRGRKHPARALSRLLIGHPRLPIVWADFKSSRQLARSLRTLLEHALRRRERKAYVVGVPLDVFEAMAARVGAAFDDAVGATRSASTSVELMDPEEVPRELEQKLLGDSREMRVVRQWIVRAAREDVPLLVLGDTGTGKEVVARAIHHLNPARHHQPFLPVNCGAIPRELFESEVFGYVPGAFTHALRKGSVGLWRAAKGGTLFLDEIGELAPEHQAKVLRSLEHRRIRPVGAVEEIDVDARVIAATNRDLHSMMQSGEFREDLYYRLGSMVITLPRLRDRPEDVAQLAAHFWREIAPRRPPLAAEVLRELAQYPWQGNARELRYIVMNLHTTFPKSVPDVARLKAVFRLRSPGEGPHPDNGGEEALRRIDSLRSLRRALAAVDGCRRVVRTFARQADDVDGRSRLRAEVGSCLLELQLLGTRPERFPDVAAFEAINRLAGRLGTFQTLLMRDDANALRYCKKELASETDAARVVVRRQEELLLTSL